MDHNNPGKIRQLKKASRLTAQVCMRTHDVREWSDRLLDGLLDLFDARFSAIAIDRLPEQPGGFSCTEVSLQRGLEPELVKLWGDTYMDANNSLQSEFIRRIINIPSRFVTVRRQDVMNDEEWYAQPVVQNLHRQCNVDANIASFIVSPQKGKLYAIAVHRAWGAPQFSDEDRRLMRWLHLELARAWGEQIATVGERTNTVSNLPERLRQVLWLLCLGRSEKEIAAQLQLSTHTVHNHVRRLYKALDVNSRAELLATALRLEGMGGFIDVPNPRINQLKRHDAGET